jgi:Zn ribbon nucleic-acid-binding protein
MEVRCPQCGTTDELQDSVELSRLVLHECQGCHRTLQTDLKTGETVEHVRVAEKFERNPT